MTETPLVPAPAASRAGSARRSSRDTQGPDRVSLALFSLAALLVVLAFLGSQLGAIGATAGKRPREVLVRRIYRTTIVERVSGPSAGGSGAGGQTVSQSVSGSAALPATPAAPVTRAS